QRFLQNAWRADPTWNELWHVPELVPQPTGWENSPLLARSKILDYLARLKDPGEIWFMIDDFVAALKQVDPDFQRPDGDYESWYIKDNQGEYLMGFENWDKVEGTLIRQMLTQLLPLLGVVELGLPAENSEPVRFRLTPSGAAFLAGESISPRPDEKPGLLRVDNNFLTTIPAHASLYDRFQLARFAELERREPNRVVYQITRASVSRAMRNGVTVDQIVTFLGRATNNRTPLKVVENLRIWGQRRDTVQLERATLLRLKHEALATELRQHPALAKLLGERVGPTAFLIPADNVTEVRRLLMELGYLES
ncbi:MAG TPA: helicase-associated domain-containing protein, partial [Anaerolineae bacterium]